MEEFDLAPRVGAHPPIQHPPRKTAGLPAGKGARVLTDATDYYAWLSAQPRDQNYRPLTATDCIPPEQMKAPLLRADAELQSRLPQ